MLTKFKSAIISSNNIKTDRDKFINLIGNDCSEEFFDNTDKINTSFINLLNGSINLCEINKDSDLIYDFDMKNFNQENGMKALSFQSDSIEDDLEKFKIKGLKVSEIKKKEFIDAENSIIEILFFTIIKENKFGLDLVIFEEKNLFSKNEIKRENDQISKFNQVVIYTSESNDLKKLLMQGLDIRCALDKEFDFGNGKIRMMFFRVGGVTIEVVENKENEGTFFGGIGWHTENMRFCHKRLSENNFDISEIRKGRKPGTLVSTIKNAPLNIPTILIGLDD